MLRSILGTQLTVLIIIFDEDKLFLLFSQLFLAISFIAHVKESLGLSLVVELNSWQKIVCVLKASSMVMMGSCFSLSLTASEQSPQTHSEREFLMFVMYSFVQSSLRPQHSHSTAWRSSSSNLTMVSNSLPSLLFSLVTSDTVFRSNWPLCETIEEAILLVTHLYQPKTKFNS